MTYILGYICITITVFLLMHFVTERNHVFLSGLVGILWPLGVLGLIVGVLVLIVEVIQEGLS